MGTATGRERNQTVDMLRGIAMLLVVLGHTMTGCIAGAHDTFVYNVVWSLQMPLFFLISGYVTRYGKTIMTIKDCIYIIGKRTLAYLLPWSVWSIVIMGYLFQGREAFDLYYLIFHMDSGYWFLIAIWIVSIMHIIASYLSRRNEKAFLKVLIYAVAFFGQDGILFIIGKAFGMNFLGIKFSLYYSIFFFVGKLYSEMTDTRIERGFRSVNKTLILHGKDVIIAISTFVYIYCLTRYSLFNLTDSYKDVIIRFIASLTGCVAVGSLVSEFLNKKRKWVGYSLLQSVGTHSLEMYLTHYLLLNLIVSPEAEAQSVLGVILVVSNFTVTVILTGIIYFVLEQNRILKFVLYGKK